MTIQLDFEFKARGLFREWLLDSVSQLKWIRVESLGAEAVVVTCKMLRDCLYHVSCDMCAFVLKYSVDAFQILKLKIPGSSLDFCSKLRSGWTRVESRQSAGRNAW